jgi:hypothetical protein
MSKSLVPLCEHIKDDGNRCGSPARGGKHFCHYHLRMQQSAARHGKFGLDVLALESTESVQIAVTHIFRALAEDAIDTRKANSMFRGLSLILATLRPSQRKSTLNQSASASPVRDVPTTTEPCGADTPVRDVFTTTNSKLPPQPAAAFALSPAELSNVRRVMRQGPKHPDFARCARLLDAHITHRTA